MIVESDLNLQHNLFSSSNSNISLIGQLQIDFTEHSVRSCVEQNWSTATIALPTKHHCLNPLQSKSILKSNRWVTPIDRCHVSLQVHRVAHTNTSTHTLTRIQTYITLHTHTHTHTSPVAQSQVAISRRRRPPSSVSSLPWSISTKKRIYCHILVRRYQHFSINKYDKQPNDQLSKYLHWPSCVSIQFYPIPCLFDFYPVWSIGLLIGPNLASNPIVWISKQANTIFTSLPQLVHL